MPASSFRDRIVSATQGDAEWLTARCGCVTASHLADVMARLKRSDGESASRLNYRWQLVSERLTGLTTESYVNAAMEWGIIQEPIARAAYGLAKDVAVEQVGFVLHPTIKYCGASPDGLVGDDGLVEIKCPNTTTHLQYILADVVPSEYRPQMLWQMACCERQWCDFVSYDPRMPEHLQLFTCRLERDDALIAAMEAAVVAFLMEVQVTIDSLPRKGKTVLEQQLEKSVSAVSGLGR